MATLQYLVFHSLIGLLQRVILHFLTSSLSLRPRGYDWGGTTRKRDMVVPTCCCMLKEVVESVCRYFGVETGKLALYSL